MKTSKILLKGFTHNHTRPHTKSLPVTSSRCVVTHTHTSTVCRRGLGHWYSRLSLEPQEGDSISQKLHYFSGFWKNFSFLTRFFFLLTCLLVYICKMHHLLHWVTHWFLFKFHWRLFKGRIWEKHVARNWFLWGGPTAPHSRWEAQSTHPSICIRQKNQHLTCISCSCRLEPGSWY